MTYSIYPLVCQGYHVTEPVYLDDNYSIHIPYADSDNCQGWESTTYFKFSGDGQRVVWLCPDCAKRWNEEKQERISNILDMATKPKFLPRALQLYNELLALGATYAQKSEFSFRVLETERKHFENTLH